MTTELAPLTGRRADIQVLRGLAVLLVVLYHAHVVVPGGYIGVDVFFVISGFVIGRLLVEELRTTGRLSFRAFYARRFRRILPALALMLAVVVLLAPLLEPIGGDHITNATAAWSTLFSANFFLYAHDVGGYFASASTLNPLLHTWSLAVEEQFYLLIPAALLVTWRASIRRGRGDPITAARLLVGAITLASLSLCITMSTTTLLLGDRGLSFAYFSPFTRAWEFCIGLGLVLLPRRWCTVAPAARAGLAVIGYGGIIASALVISDTTTFPGAAALLPVIATAAAIHASVGWGPFSRPFVLLGDNSYGWYLWHWPLIVFAAAFWPRSGSAPLLAAAAVALGLAVVTRQLLELRIVPRVARHPVLLTATCMVVPFLAIAMSRPVQAHVNRIESVQLARSAPDDYLALNRDVCGKARPLGPSLSPSCTANPDGARSIVLIGDSNATQLSRSVLDLAAPLDAQVQVATATGCPPVLDPDPALLSTEKCQRYLDLTIADLRAHPRDVVMFTMTTSGWAGRIGVGRSAAEGDALLAEQLRSTLAAIADTGARTILIAESPKPRWTQPAWQPGACSALAAIVDRERCAFSPFRPESSAFAIRSADLERTAVGPGGIERWTFADQLCPDDRCHQFLDGAPLWADGGHLTRHGASTYVPRLLELLSAPTAPPPTG